MKETQKAEKPIEFPFEQVNTFLLSFVPAYFAKACGLEYKYLATKALRIIKLENGFVHVPFKNKDQKTRCIPTLKQNTTSSYLIHPSLPVLQRLNQETWQATIRK